jgi:hypothetical protein
VGEETAVMGSLLERLEQREQREAAARVRVEELRVEMTALAERLAAEEALLERLAIAKQIAKQTVIEVLAEDDPAQEAGVGVVAVARIPGAGVQVPAFAPDGEGAGRLPVAYRDVVEVLADAGVPLRASKVCQALGLGAEPRHREGMRSKPRAAGRAWLAGRGLPGPARAGRRRGWCAQRRRPRCRWGPAKLTKQKRALPRRFRVL